MILHTFLSIKSSTHTKKKPFEAEIIHHYLALESFK